MLAKASLVYTAIFALAIFQGCMNRQEADRDEADSSVRIELSKNGVTAYSILIAEDAKPYEKTAAQELSSYLGKITQAVFPVVVESDTPASGPVISVGMTQRLAHAFPDLEVATLKPDSMVMKTQGQNLYLAGEGTRGTLYAVYSFVEDNCGVRWWTPFEEHVPRHAVLEVDIHERIYQPPFYFRETNSQIFNDTILRSNHLKLKDGLDERLRFSVRSKNNGLALQTIPEEWGGSLRLIDMGQNPKVRNFQEYNHFISVDDFGRSHPEWFCERGGKRQSGARHLAQLCLSNQAMRREFLERAKKWVDSLPNRKLFVIMHNDNEYYCQCAKCAAIDEEEGSPSGSQTRFMNDIAEKLEEHRPGIEIWMDAYAYTTKPPKITRPRQNLGIILCTPIKSQRVSEDQEFMAKWAEWKPISSKIMIWDYTVNFGSFVNPWPNLRHLGPNIRTFQENGASGVFEQGNIFNSVTDCEELKSWVISQMLWDPSRDADKRITEFVNGYYGTAAGPVMAYLDHIVEHGGSIPGGLRGGESACAWLDLAAMNQATKLLDEARTKAAGDPALEEKIAKIRMTLDHQWLLGWRKYREEADRRGLEFLGPESALQALEIFRGPNSRFRSTHDCEGYGYGTMNTQLSTMEKALTALDGEPPPPPFDKTPAGNYIHLQEDCMLGISKGAKVVDDPLASNGKAFWTSCNHKDWNIQVHEKFLRTVCRMTGLKGKWRVFCYVRADAKKESGDAMQVGIWSYKVPGMCVTRTLRIEDLQPGTYTPVEVGIIDFDKDPEKVSVWAAPMDNPDVMNAIYVDRVVMIREKNSEQ
jgi:hypothetical protein